MFKYKGYIAPVEPSGYTIYHKAAWGIALNDSLAGCNMFTYLKEKFLLNIPLAEIKEELVEILKEHGSFNDSEIETMLEILGEGTIID